jgi:hypothetical protein
MNQAADTSKLCCEPAILLIQEITEQETWKDEKKTERRLP